MIYLAVWWLLGRFYWQRSLEQDRTGDPSLTLGMERLSPIALLLYSVTGDVRLVRLADVPVAAVV